MTQRSLSLDGGKTWLTVNENGHREFDGGLRPLIRATVKAPRAAPPAVKNLPVAGGHLHLLCPGGLGDLYWILHKWYGVARQRPVTFWFPKAEQQRAGELCQLLGLKHGYMPNLLTSWVWNQPGDPALPARERGGWLPVHANRHLESGKLLEDWYPDLPMQRPPLEEVAWPCDREWAGQEFVLAHMCHRSYMQGNLTPIQWAGLLKRVHDEVAPVRLVGRGKDLEFAAHVMQHYHSGLPHLFDLPLNDLLGAARNAKAFIGVAGGPGIVASHFCPTLMGYPDWLWLMPGSWEPNTARVRSVILTQLPGAVAAGDLNRLTDPDFQGKPNRVFQPDGTLPDDDDEGEERGGP